MKLLNTNVPNEVVDIIIHYLVSHNVREAWRLRGVCTTFRKAITDDILMCQGKDVLRSGSKIMDNLMPQYLRYRLIGRLDVHDLLLVHIDAMKTYLAQELDLQGQKDEDECLNKLCIGVVEIMGAEEIEIFLSDKWKDFRLHWYDGMRSCAAELTLNQRICAAMMVQACNLLEVLLRQLAQPGVIDFRHSSPLFAAVALSDNELLSVILEHLGSDSVANTPNALADLRLRPAIQLAIKQRDSYKTRLLLEYVCNSHFSGSQDEYEYALQYAAFVIKPGNVEIVRAILQTCSEGQRVGPGIFLRACKSGNLEILRTLLQYGKMELDKGTRFDLPIHQAIRSGNTAVIGAVLDAGADINNRSYEKEKEGGESVQSPLEFAISCNVEPAVNFLLERGAIVPPLEKWSTIPNPRIYDTLITALITRTGDKATPTLAENLRWLQNNRDWRRRR